MLVDAAHPALEHGEEILDRLSAGLAARPFLYRMVDGFVAFKFSARHPITAPFVRHKRALGISMRFERAAQFCCCRVIDRHGARFTAALYQRKDSHGGAIPLFAPSCLGGKFPSAATALFVQERFVGFNGFAFAAEWAVIVFVHALANAVL